VLIEDVENGFEETMGHQHPGGYHVDDGDALLGGNRFENIGSTYAPGGDAGALVARIARIQHQHGDVFLDGRQQSGGVQDFGSEVCQFGRFFKPDLLDAACAGAKTGIGCLHAVHIGPDLDTFRFQAGSHDGSREV
jgi:hypothetical protein